MTKAFRSGVRDGARSARSGRELTRALLICGCGFRPADGSGSLPHQHNGSAVPGDINICSLVYALEKVLERRELDFYKGCSHRIKDTILLRVDPMAACRRQGGSLMSCMYSQLAGLGIRYLPLDFCMLRDNAWPKGQPARQIGFSAVLLDS